MNCAPRCRTCAPAKPACAASWPPSTPRPPTGTPTSNSPMTWTASSPSCAAAPPPPASANASGGCACSSKTSSSGPTRSPSATASPSGTGPRAATATTIQPTRRVTCARVIHCVGGVITPLLANIYLHVLDTEFTRRGLGELVRYADDGVVLCRSAAQARAALDAIGEILGPLGRGVHPDKTKVVDLRQGREGLAFLRCPFHARIVGPA